MTTHPLATLYGREEHFSWRGESISRLEAFSDAVFGFAVTLLIVSGEVPKTFDQLIVAIRGFPAFAICFALLVWLWYCHYQFFRRYGLETPWTIFLNACLLFFVLLYVYPLKYLFTVATSSTTSNNLTVEQGRTLFILYGLGYAAVFLTLALLYCHAWLLRGRLGLNPVECLKTKIEIINHLVMAGIGICSALIARTLPAADLGFTGVFYLSIPAYYTCSGFFFGAKTRKLAAELHAKEDDGHD
jgi:uncharacterized membrane protein